MRVPAINRILAQLGDGVPSEGRDFLPFIAPKARAPARAFCHGHGLPLTARQGVDMVVVEHRGLAGMQRERFETVGDRTALPAMARQSHFAIAEIARSSGVTAPLAQLPHARGSRA